VRTLYRAAAALAFALTGLAGTAGTARSADTIAQASATQGTLTGRVTNSRGDGLAGAVVTVSGGATTLTATTRGDGSFTLAVPPGVYSVVVNRGGYQSTQTDDVAVVAGATARLAIALSESSTQSLRTIGRVSTSTNRNPINTNVAAVSTLSNAVIYERAPTNLNDVATELPGVSVARTSGATANTFFETRGFFIQQKVNIDGHPVASGQFGNWNTNYATPFLFGQIEVLKGAGLNGPTAGESAIGTINLRTRDFTPKNTFEITTGIDSYTGSYLHLFGSANFLNGRLSVLAARSSTGYNGPWNDYFTNRIAASPLTGLPVGTYQVQSPNGLVQFQGDLSNKYGLEGELAKIRYRLSQSTSVSFEYLGLQGQYFPQGGAYSSYVGHVNIPNCFTGGVAQFTPAGCGVTSTYSAPYAQSLAGTQAEGYQWFPNSYVQNNEPQFSAELRTSFKNDTILLRPYTAEINRFINGQYEVLYPGNNGPWFQVTSTANCQVNFVAATAANGGAKGPCFTSSAQYNSPAYVGANPGNLHFIFPTTPNAPACSPAAPCWTTSTVASNDGSWAYGTPFSQPERDYMHGFTFSYIHPVGDNVYNFSWDANIENSTFFSGDTNPRPAGCRYVIGAGVANDPSKPYYQPTCTLGVTPNTPIGFLPKTPIGYPPTNIRKNDFALTGQFQLTPQLQLAVGNYLSVYKPDAQVEDPNVLAAYSTGGNVPGAAPVALIHTGKSIVHYDPHVGVLFRPSRDVSLRGTVGSSITMPYASVISGIDRIDLPNGANSQTYTLTQANPTLLPETQMSYDLGGDLRLHDGGLISADVYDITIYNAFAANTVPLTGSALATAQATAPGAAGGYFNNKTINVGQLRAYGVELAISRNPLLGWGYRLTGSLQRAYFDKIPQSVYLAGQTSLVAGKQLDGLNGSISVPFAKSYGELRYAFPNDGLITLGADYEGNNNSTYGPPYTLWNTTVKFPLAKGVPLQIAVDNLFNLNTGSALGRALLNQGSQSVRYGCNATGTVCSYSGSAKSLQFVYPRNVRVQLSTRL
jgi:outer membrane receptor protein involved in Fe transport